MKNKISTAKIFFLTLSALLFFSGCGGGSDNKTIKLLEGVFVDSAVKGLYYETPTQKGYTDIEGRFKYKPSESITFYLGNLNLGTVKAKNLITVVDLNNDNYQNIETLSNRSLNTLRVLQTLDKDSDTNNGIEIIQEINELNITDLDLDDESHIKELIDILNNKYNYNKTLLTPLKAKTHFEETLKDIQSFYYFNDYLVEIKMSVVGNNVIGTIEDNSEIYNIYGQTNNSGKFFLETDSIDGYYFKLELQKDIFGNYTGRYIKYDHLGEPYDYYYSYYDEDQYEDVIEGYFLELYKLIDKD